MVALTGGPEGDTLIRCAARVTARIPGSELLALHVIPSDGLTHGDPPTPEGPYGRPVTDRDRHLHRILHAVFAADAFHEPHVQENTDATDADHKVPLLVPSSESCWLRRPGPPLGSGY